jgi:hypothetical protein
MEHKCFHHLSRLRCRQDENEFTLALMSVLSTNTDFRNRFLRECGYDIKGIGLEFTQHFQWTSAFGRPDFLLEVKSGKETLALISVEVKVRSPVRKQQLRLHIDGLVNRRRMVTGKGLKEPFSRLVVLTKSDQPEVEFEHDVKWLTWDGVHTLLKQSKALDPVAKYLTEALAGELEARGMTQFEGFNVEEWGRFVDLYTEHKDVLERVENEVARFVSRLKDRVKDAVERKEKPFDFFSRKIHGRGREFEFWTRGLRGTPGHNYYTGMKIDPYEGWIEVFISAEGSKNSIALLKNLKDKGVVRRLNGWSVWHIKGHREDLVRMGVYKEVIRNRPAEAALILRSYLNKESESFRKRGMERKIWKRIEKACEISRMLR